MRFDLRFPTDSTGFPTATIGGKHCQKEFPVRFLDFGFRLWKAASQSAATSHNCVGVSAVH